MSYKALLDKPTMRGLPQPCLVRSAKKADRHSVSGTCNILMGKLTANANLVVDSLPAAEKRLAEIRAIQLEDGVRRHCYALLYGGLAQPPIFVIGTGSVLANAS